MVHFVAAFIITLSGIHIDLIEVMQVSINFEVITWEFSILDWPLSISPVSDLITILWIVGVINALNWVSGIDGLAAMMSLFAAVTMLFIGVRTEALFAAALAAILAGSISGFLPYNFPPARTFNGSIGDMVQGYLLAILAIISSAKLSTSLILLALPIIDAVWVVLGRLRRHRKEINNPLDILKISDKTHLHHRFLDMGFSVRQTLAIETIIFLGFCIMAYYFAGFSDQTLVVMIAVFTCFVLFVIVAIVRSMAIKRRANKVEEKPKAQVVEEESPEEQYTY
jgi:UDP-GlcNAc:undecaprenyl-phosphate GlcNAc-1-phosphate transferase